VPNHVLEAVVAEFRGWLDEAGYGRHVLRKLRQEGILHSSFRMGQPKGGTIAYYPPATDEYLRYYLEELRDASMRSAATAAAGKRQRPSPELVRHEKLILKAKITGSAAGYTVIAMPRLISEWELYKIDRALVDILSAEDIHEASSLIFGAKWRIAPGECNDVLDALPEVRKTIAEFRPGLYFHEQPGDPSRLTCVVSDRGPAYFTVFVGADGRLFTQVERGMSRPLERPGGNGREPISLHDLRVKLGLSEAGAGERDKGRIWGYRHEEQVDLSAWQTFFKAEGKHYGPDEPFEFRGRTVPAGALLEFVSGPSAIRDTSGGVEFFRCFKSESAYREFQQTVLEGLADLIPRDSLREEPKEKSSLALKVRVWIKDANYLAGGGVPGERNFDSEEMHSAAFVPTLICTDARSFVLGRLRQIWMSFQSPRKLKNEHRPTPDDLGHALFQRFRLCGEVGCQRLFVRTETRGRPPDTCGFCRMRKKEASASRRKKAREKKRSRR